MPFTSASNRQVTIAAYPRKLLQLFDSEWGMPAGRLLEGTGLTPEQLDRPDRLVPLSAVFLLFHRAALLCPVPDLALRYARCLPPSSHGQLGMATLSAASLREVVDLYYHYMAVVAPFVLLHREERRGQLVLVLDLITELPVHESFVMELLLATAFNIIEPLLGPRVRELALHLACPPPAHAGSLQAHCQGCFSFNASFNGLSIPMHLLDAPNPTADPVRHAELLQQINARMDLLMARGSFVEAVRQHLAAQDGPLPRMEAVAEAFGLSVRTFRSRLAQDGRNYQALLD
ncbi:MAG: AraC family transcriptional regulator, partial [Perlucidibaca sp.]